jgi:RimJ/RimL family protein N-acetyltransferase
MHSGIKLTYTMNFPFEHDIILENSSALLRPIDGTDVDNLLAVATKDKDLLEFSPMPVYTRELLEKYIGKAIDSRRNKNSYPFVVFDKRKNAFAGSTSFLNISNADDRLEIGGTWYGKEFQRTGLNRNCKYLLLEYAFNNLNAERVEFKTDERNLASRKAIEKIGGQFEGILRRHTLMYDGFRRNTVYYSILKSEWNGLKDLLLKAPY